jgi:hypothetical protein
MKQDLLYLIRLFGAKLLILFFLTSAQGQILQQDFESLTALEQFSQANNPGPGQVNVLLEKSTDGLTHFSLVQEQGQRKLRLSKGSNNQVYWIKDQGFGNPGVLRLQFDLAVSGPAAATDASPIAFGAFFIGENLARNRNFPEFARRFTTLELLWASPGRFRLENRVSNAANGGHTAANGTTISIVMNNSGAAFTYLAPDGTPETIADRTVDIWANQSRVVNDAAAQHALPNPSPPLQEVKFVTRNTSAVGLADFDNLLIEAVPPYIPPVALNPAGGNYTVGVGGDFMSLTRPGGVFDALNQLAAISGPFLFEVISNLPDETGEIALQELAGARAENTITFRPRAGSSIFTISGSNQQSAGALIHLQGADWVRFDGRDTNTAASGMAVAERLLFRNTGSSATLRFSAGATHNYVGYCLLQGRSQESSLGVITLGGAGGGNSENTFEYNEIGGYADYFPLNAMASNAPAAAPNTAMVVRGNEFYSFGAKGSNSEDHPAELFLGTGSTGWTITENHFYLRQGEFTIDTEAIFSLRGIRIVSGSDYSIRQNYFGGQAPFAGGGPMHIRTTNQQQAYASILPLSFESQNGTALFEQNVVANMVAETRATPLQGNALAISAVAYAGQVAFIENEFHDLWALSSGSASVLQGGYAIIPIHFRNRPGAGTSGSVLGNKIYAIRLSGSRSGAGGTYLLFRGIFVDTQAHVPEILNNRISDVEAQVSGRLGADLMGIVYQGLAPKARIERNIICDLSNGSTFGEAVAINPLLFGATGLYTQHVSGELLIANNMISLSTPQTESATSLHGLYINSSAQQPTSIYFNTIYAYGPANASARTNHLLRREGSVPVVIRNNIFLDTRATGQVNYVIYSRLAAGFSSDHNLLYQQQEGVPYPDFGYIAGNSALNLQQWQQLTATASGQAQDLNSISENVEGYFVDRQTCNLRILETISPLSPTIDAGTELAEVTTDIDGVVRINPDMGASEAFNAWIGQVDSRWDNPANWSRGAVPDCQANNLIGILPNGMQIYNQPVRFQPVITIPDAYYRNLVVLPQASITIGSANGLLQQCGVENPLLEGITNRGSIAYAAPGEIRLMGVLRNEHQWQSGTGLLSLTGADRQNLNSSSPLDLWDLRLAGGGAKQLEEIESLSVANSLILEDGILYSSAESLLRLGPDAQTAGTPSDSAHVDGPMVKEFATATEFVYPTGDSGQLGRLALTPEQGGASAFRLQYFFSPPPVPTSPADMPAAFEEVAQVSEREHWTIYRQSGTATAQLALYWDEQSGIGGLEEEELVVARWSSEGSRWVDEGNEGVEAVAAPDKGRLLSAPGRSVFGSAGGGGSIFTFGTTNPEAPLPVTLISFTAVRQGQDVQLHWRTATEENNSHFLVQRSHNGTSFTTLGTVATKAEGGNSLEELAYSFTDAGIADAAAGTLYYRLQQIDNDGTSDYSPLVLVQLSNEGFAVNGIYPNPFSENLVINVSGAKEQVLQLRLLHSDGRQLAQEERLIAAGESILPVLKGLQLPAGLYLLEIKSADFTGYYRVVKK